MPPSRIQIAKPDIARLFREMPSKILSLGEIRQIVAQHRAFWRLAESTTVAEFLAFMLKESDLRDIKLDFPARPVVRYMWGDVPTLPLVQSINEDGYFTHYTAMQLHGLTEQVPKAVYFNVEQTRRGGGGELVQTRINNAFRGKPRETSNVTTFRNQRIHLLNGQNTGKLGLLDLTLPDGWRVRVTGIERTLIDATVRPNYSGGVFEVAKAFRLAHGRFSVNRLVAILRNLGFTYPYHQAIGSYLERAGLYKDTQIALLRQFPREFDFYLDYGMKSPAYDERWRLYVPQNF